MVKLTNLFKQNIKLFIGIIIGGILFGGSAYVIATEIASSSVTYTENGQTTVEGALNTLYTRANTWVNPNDMGTPQYYAFGTYKGWCTSTDTICNSFADFPTTATTPPSGKNVYAVKYGDEQYGVCIQRNGKEHCFRGRNYKAEAKHVQEVFSDISCNVRSSSVTCSASDFDCFVSSDGIVDCLDLGIDGIDEVCSVVTDGAVYCS